MGRDWGLLRWQGAYLMWEVVHIVMMYYQVMWFGNELGWTGENKDNLLGSLRYFTEVETRLWWATLQQHELYHYLFSLYPEFHLEDEAHQWFDRSKWPQDFVGM